MLKVGLESKLKKIYLQTPEQGGGIYLSLSYPGGLVPREEDLHSDRLTVPDTAPNLTVPSLANAFSEGNLLGESSLNEEGKTRTAARGHRVVEDLPQRGVPGSLGSQPNQLVLVL